MANYFFEQIRDINDEFVCSLPHERNTFPAHLHKQMEVIYVVKGQNRVTINDTTLILTDNQLAIADSFDSHEYEHITDTSITMILPYYALSQYNDFKNGRALATNFILDEAVGLQFKELIDLMYRNRYDKFILDGLITAFTGLIIKHIPLVKNETTAHRLLVLDILKYVEENFKKELTLEETAKHFAYSKYYFSKLFNNLLGCHFETYINIVRTQNVLHLIKDKKYNITDAVSESGFSSIPTFYRFFKSKYKCSIKTYIKQQKALEEYDNAPFPHFFR